MMIFRRLFITTDIGRAVFRKQTSVDTKDGDAKSTLRDPPVTLTCGVLAWAEPLKKGLQVTDVGLIYLILRSEDAAQCLKSNSVRGNVSQRVSIAVVQYKETLAEVLLQKYLKVIQSCLENAAWLIVIAGMRATKLKTRLWYLKFGGF